MKFLVVIDEYGWAFEFFARGWKKYSRHQVDFLKWTEVSAKHISDYDIVFSMSSVVYERLVRRVALSGKKAVCGIRSLLSHEQAPDPSRLLACVANSSRAYEIAREKHSSASNIFYLRGAVDGNEWIYSDVSANRKVGWSGNPNQSVKRVHLLNRIAKRYGGVSKKTDWGVNLFVPGRARGDQLAWYRTLGCYVQTSSSEGLSQSLMEALACGVPVVATPAGDTAKLVPAEWLLPMEEDACVREADAKIERLFLNPMLAKEVGAANRRKFDSEGWCWSVRAGEYDALLEGLAK